MRRIVFCRLIVTIATVLLPCLAAVAEDAFTLTSSDFQPGGSVPARFSCDAAGDSPALHWTAPPKGTHSFALVVRDPDAPRGTFIHWVLYNLPAPARSLPRKLATAALLPDGSRQGVNSARSTGYIGPCPPPGPAHHYIFTLYALDTEAPLPPGATEHELMQAIQGHVRATAELTGLYQH
jgi:hypothetical protein